LFETSLAIARTHSRRLISTLALSLGLLAVGAIAGAQVNSFGGNAQHTNLYTPAAQTMNKIRWQTSIDTSNSGEFGHYGAPLVTAANTVIVPVLVSGVAIELHAFDGATGAAKWTVTTDYVFPPHSWLPEYQACISGSRLYYQGAGGTLYYVTDIDTNSPSAPTQVCFYGMSTYQADKANFDGNLFIDTPLTPDSSGNVFFGFRIPVGQSAPAPFTTISGYAKIDSSGNGSYALVDAMTGDANITRDLHNAAPALSNDESKLYVVVGKNDTRYYGYLVALNTSNMSTSSQVFLLDPRNGNNAGVLDDSTATPMVAPDGDVFLGVFANPYNGSRGFLTHFSGDLSVTKPYGGFGWDYTPAIVPASMVPSYNGPSSYLLFCKYNNYDTTGLDDGDGVNRVAVLDPNALQTDAHPSSNGLQIMREVQTVIGFTPDPESPQSQVATREMCVNASCVNPATDSVFFNSEDGRAYRWNLASNQVTESIVLTPGFGEPYVPSVIGTDGTVYTLNGGNLFAMGAEDNDSMTLSSSQSDSRTALPTDSITFTAHVNFSQSAVHTAGVSADQITFTDSYYDGFNYTTNSLGTFPIDGSGNAQVTTTLSAGTGSTLGNHFINAQYSGNANSAAVGVTLVQKVHAFASSTALQAVGNPSPFGQPVVLTATVTGVGTTNIPTGQVTFLNDGKVIGQVPVDGTGVCSFTTSDLKGGAHQLRAYYQSDTNFAASANNQDVTISDGTTLSVGSSPNPSTVGQSVTFTATASAADANAGTPTGDVVFTIDGSAGSPVSVDGNGQATYNTSTLGLGSHTVSAAFTGSNGWGNNSANGSDQVVNPATKDTTTTVGSNNNPSVIGQSVTYTATVVPQSGNAIPTGSVQFKNGVFSMGTVTLDGTGHASITQSLSLGNHTITAKFVGTGGWLGSQGQMTQVVGPDVTPPTPPGNVHMTPGPGMARVTISWDASTDPDDAVNHYEVWRSPMQNEHYNLVSNTVNTTFTDAIGHQQNRRYYIIAVDSHGNRSAPSEIIIGTGF
jgi:hypothetical protein